MPSHHIPECHTDFVSLPQYSTSVTLSLGPLISSHHFPGVPPPQSHLIKVTHSLSRDATPFTAHISRTVAPHHLLHLVRRHHSRHPTLSSSPVTLSGLIMSFLLMVPEAASPSGPPSSKMSRTSAPVAIVPEGGAPRGQGSVPEEGPGSGEGGGRATSAQVESG